MNIDILYANNSFDKNYRPHELDEMASNNAVIFIKILGSLDSMKDIRPLQAKIEQFAQYGCSQIVFDLEEVTYVSSTGLGALVGMYDSVEKKGGQIILLNVHSRVQTVFNMVGLNGIFKLPENREEAITYFGQ